MDSIFSVIILIASVVIHEVAHGVTALYFGDETAKRMGRLTLNPIKHLDPVGSIFLPLLMVVLNTGVVFGWARPVPYNPYNLRNRRLAEPMVALAGPLSNISIAIIMTIVIRSLFFFHIVVSTPFIQMLASVVLINLALALFNLVPIPPLDGSKLLYALLPARYDYIKTWLDKNGFILVFVFIFFLWQYLAPVVMWLYQILLGI